MATSSRNERKKKNKARRAEQEQRSIQAYRRRAGLDRDHEEVPLASWVRRLFALTFDQVFFGIFSLIWIYAVLGVFHHHGRSFGAPKTVTPSLAVVFAPQLIYGLLYVVPRIKKRGRTFGQRRVKIVVINEDGTGLLSWKQSFLRWFGVFGASSTVLLLLSFISKNEWYEFILILLYLFIPIGVMAPAAKSPKNQGLHDRLAGSVVIRESPLLEARE